MIQDYFKEFGEITLFGAGWKPISLVDIRAKSAFTLWLCGCNLKCPFCHNYRLADSDPNLCKNVDVERLLKELDFSIKLVDCFLVTGGEPLLQFRELTKLLKIVKGCFKLDVAVNSNLTLTHAVKSLLDNSLCDFIITDLKIPHHQLYGLDGGNSDSMWESYLESLRIASKRGIKMEVRIPVVRKMDLECFELEVKEVLNILHDSRCEYYFRVNPILGEPFTIPRNILWASEYCNPSQKEIGRVREVLDKLGLSNKIV